jgi:hypothetical protein
MSPIYYEYYYLNGSQLDGYNPPTATDPSQLKIPDIDVDYNSTGTIATVTVTPPPAAVGSYGGSVAGSSSFNDPDYVINSTSNTFTIGQSPSIPLSPGKVYTLRLRAYSGPNATGLYGDYYYFKMVPPLPGNVAGSESTVSETQTPEDIENQLTDTGTAVAYKENREVQRSLLTVTNNNKDRNKYSIVTKDTNIDTDYDYYTFGSSMFFSANINKTNGSGGIGFFTNSTGTTGYYISIQTVTNLGDTADKAVKILKLKNNKQTILQDSQTSKSALTGVLGGIAYKVDVVVTKTGTSNKIAVYVNNFKITATDETDPLPVTSNVALIANTGKVSFDYVYASPLTQEQYEKGLVENIYEGRYGIRTLSFLYGDKIIEDQKYSPNFLPFLEEFGVVARELKKIKVKYEARPADPIYSSVGINKYAEVLGQRLSSFGAEVYVINNSGTFVPLDDSKIYSFAIIGNYVVTTGQHEYVSNELSETTIPEPVIFESAWIQTEADAKNLSSWIEKQWAQQQVVIDMEIVGNPLLSVGDIIAINYPKNNLSTTQKFVVTSVNNTFKEGLSTTISARSIYS